MPEVRHLRRNERVFITGHEETIQCPNNLSKRAVVPKSPKCAQQTSGSNAIITIRDDGGQIWIDGIVLKFHLIVSLRDSAEEISLKSNQRQMRLINHFNLLEILAAGLNAQLFGKIAQRIATDRLVTDLSLLQESDPARQLLEKAITSSSTFAELAKFFQSFRTEIRQLEEQRSQRPLS